MNRPIQFLFSTFPVLILTACASPRGGVGTAQMDALAGVSFLSRDYRLPESDIPATQHDDSGVLSVIRGLQRRANQQDLIFDGSKAGEGVVVVGKQGNHDQMLLILHVYRTPDGGFAWRDLHSWNGADMRAGMKMRDRFFSDF